MTSKYCTWGMALVGAILQAVPVQAAPVGTAFTYQGQLKQDGVPANGRFDFRFSLQTTQFGVVLPAPQCRRGVTVVNGLFTTDVEFPAGTFVGPPFSLQVHVKTFNPNEIFDCTPNTFDPFTAVGPPQPIQPTPYALHALSAPPGSSLDAPDGSPIDALVVDAEGNVGIGTLVPISKLQVAGDIRSDGTIGIQARNPNNVSANAFLGWLNDIARIRIGGNGTGAANGLDIQTTSDRSLLRLTHDGLVGINTASPQTELHVFDDGAARIRVESATGQAGISFLSDSTVENVIYSPNGSDDLRFFMGTADRLAVTALGNVGIGTNVPVERLHVEGSAFVTGGVSAGQVETDLVIADAVTIAATTRFVSLSAADFAPGSNSKVVSSGGGPMLAFGDNPDVAATAFAPVGLPHGAVIQEFTAFVNDSSSVQNITVSLRRRDVLAAGVATMASVGTNSTPAQFQALSTTAISVPTADNQGFTYFIHATWGGSGILLAGARIEYTVTSPLP